MFVVHSDEMENEEVKTMIHGQLIVGLNGLLDQKLSALANKENVF